MELKMKEDTIQPRYLVGRKEGAPASANENMLCCRGSSFSVHFVPPRSTVKCHAALRKQLTGPPADWKFTFPRGTQTAGGYETTQPPATKLCCFTAKKNLAS